MNKAQILKQTGLTEEEFYRLYPTREHYEMAYGGPVSPNDSNEHIGTANNKTWLRQGLDYIGNLGVQDLSNNIQNYFNNYNSASNLNTNIPNVKKRISSLNRNYADNGRISYANGGQNLAGNLGQQGIQNDQVKADNIYLTSGEAGLAAFAENMPIIGGMVKAQNNKLGAREQIDRKGGMGAAAGQAFTEVANTGLSMIGMGAPFKTKSSSSSNNATDVTSQVKSTDTQNAAWSMNNDSNDLVLNTQNTNPNNYTTPELNPMQAMGGQIKGKNFQYDQTSAGRLPYNTYMSNNIRNYKAMGGQLTEVNTGGTHEQNPMGGVMVGRNASVEQGESLINKDGKPAFVLTDRIKLDSTTAQEFDLPKKYIGKTFSEIGKAENRVSDLRPEDPLTKDLLKSRNEKLEAAQEAQKARMAEKHMAKAQELAPEMFQQAQPQGMPQEQMPPQDPAMEQQMMAMQGQGMPQGMPQQPMMASGGSLNFKSSGAYNKWLGYVHANKLAENTPGNQKVSIGGEPHKVKHNLGGRMQYAYGDPIEPTNMEPVMLDTRLNPSNLRIQNVPTVSNPYTLKDLQQRDMAIDDIFRREKDMGYGNYGFTSEPAGSINTIGQAHEKYMSDYAPMMEDLPLGLQALAGDFAFNSEDPRASLMVASGYLTPEQKIKLYKNGALDKSLVDKEWSTYGQKVINDFNKDRVGFANNFDKERLRSYGNTTGADKFLPEWTNRVNASRKASGIPLTNPLINTNNSTPNIKSTIPSLGVLASDVNATSPSVYGNPSTVNDLFVGPQLQNRKAPPYSLFTNNGTTNSSTSNDANTKKLQDILLADIRIPKDRTGLKAGILGAQAALEAGRIALTPPTKPFRDVRFTTVNPNIQQAIMQANKNNDIANYKDTIRNSGASQAQFLGNATQAYPAMSGDYASRIANMRNQLEAANNQIMNSQDQINQGIQAQNIERDAQGKANLSNQLGNVTAGLVQNLLPIATEREKREMELATMGLMNTPQYTYVMDEKTGRLKKFFHPTQPGIQNTTAQIETDSEGNKWLFNTNTGTWNKMAGAYGGKIGKKGFGGRMKNC